MGGLYHPSHWRNKSWNGEGVKKFDGFGEKMFSTNLGRFFCLAQSLVKKQNFRLYVRNFTYYDRIM